MPRVAHRTIAALYCLALCVFPVAHAANATPLVFASSYPTNAAGYRYSDRYLKLLCAEARLQCRLRKLPLRRMQSMMADRTLDGEIGRVAAYAKRHAANGYLMVEQPYVTVRTYIFTAADAPAFDSWDALSKATASVGYMRGVYAYQSRLEAMAPAIQPHDMQEAYACLQMVILRRDDACIIDDGDMTEELRPLLAQGHLGKPVQQFEKHIILNGNHSALVKILNDATEQLRLRGVELQLARELFPGR